MNSSLKERFARLGPARAVDLVPSGSPAVLALRPTRSAADVKAVAAALSLARRGLGMLKAKRALEEVLNHGRAVIRLPRVEDAATLAVELRGSGIGAAIVVSEEIDVKGVRERLSLTQEQFALRYGFDLKSLQNWEVGRRKPDAAVRSYLKVIARMPDRTSEALENPLAS